MTKREQDETKDVPAAGSEALETPASGEPGVPSAEGAAAPAEAADELQADIAAVNDRLLRLQADFDNYRKRTARERAEIHARSLEGFMAELLPVLDHFELGLATASKQGLDEAVRQGLHLVLDQFRGVLGKFGLAPMNTVGHPFDPHVQESVAMIPSADHPRDTVVEETRRGYMLAGRLLRAAQVVVSSGPPEAPEAPHA